MKSVPAHFYEVASRSADQMRQSVAFLALCVAACATAEWWQDGVLYQIYPRSFADSNADGNGDLYGIIEHVPYLHSLGVDVVWLSPIYQSPWEDMGYDVSDFTDVHPIFGTLDDVKELIAGLHGRGMKLVLDLVPNHSSDKHPWFVESKKDRTNSKADFYVWKDPKGFQDSKPIPPNNWMSLFGGSAWEYVAERGQFYLHHFGKYQPDLNLTNPEVVSAMKDVMRFWLDLGVDGFRVDAVPYLVENPEFKDEDPWKHDQTQNQQGTYDLLDEFDKFIQDEYPEAFLFLEAYAGVAETMKYFNKRSAPFNFVLISNFKKNSDANDLKGIVDSYMGQVPEGKPYNWVIGNHDNPRVGTRFGEDLIDALNILTLLLPGVGITYQGEEIGMTDPELRDDQKLDHTGHSRDPARTPFQWNSTRNAGFSTANKTWLPVNPNYWRVNVKTESRSPSSHLSTYKELVKIRRGLDIDVKTASLNKWVFAFKRTNERQNYYVLINLNNVEEEVDLTKAFDDVPSSLTVRLPSGNSGYGFRESVSPGELSLRPKSGLVLESSCDFSFNGLPISPFPNFMPEFFFHL